MKNYIVHNNQVISNKTKIKLIKMDDPYHPVPSGTVGVVDTIDDMRQIHMKWENGRTLALIPSEDEFEIDNENIIYHQLKLTKNDIGLFLTPYGSSKFTPYKKSEAVNLIINACKNKNSYNKTFNTGSFTESGGGYGIDYEFYLEENEEYAIIRKQILKPETNQIETHIGLIKLA